MPGRARFLIIGWRSKLLWAFAVLGWAGMIASDAFRATARVFVIAAIASIVGPSAAIQVSWVEKRIDRMHQAQLEALAAVTRQLSRVTGPQPALRHLTVVEHPGDQTLP